LIGSESSFPLIQFLWKSVEMECLQHRPRKQLLRAAVVASTCVGETGTITIFGRHKRHRIYCGAQGFRDARELLLQYRPDILLIESK